MIKNKNINKHLYFLQKIIKNKTMSKYLLFFKQITTIKNLQKSNQYLLFINKIT